MNLSAASLFYIHRYIVCYPDPISRSPAIAVLEFYHSTSNTSLEWDNFLQMTCPRWFAVTHCGQLTIGYLLWHNSRWDNSSEGQVELQLTPSLRTSNLRRFKQDRSNYNSSPCLELSHGELPHSEMATVSYSIARWLGQADQGKSTSMKWQGRVNCRESAKLS